MILDLAIQAVNAQRGVLLMLEGEELVPRAHKGDGFRISTAVRDRVLNEKISMLVRDAQLDDAFKGRMSIVEQKVHTMMAVPLQTKDRIIGLIYVDSPFVLREFTKDDLSLLTVMANIAAIRIENARLAEDRRGRAHHEARPLAGRRDSGQHAAGQSRRDVPGTDLAGFNAACRTVGGDYYDFFPYPDGRVALALGDVSGKGMPASLMMMALHARVQVLAEDPGDSGRLHDAAEQGHLRQVPEQSLHHVLLLRARHQHRRPGVRQRRPQSADRDARLGRGARCWKAAARCWAFCRLRPIANSTPAWNTATCWCSTATA